MVSLELAVNNNATFLSRLNLIKFNALYNFTYNIYNTLSVFLETDVTGRLIIELIILTNAII